MTIKQFLLRVITGDNTFNIPTFHYPIDVSQPSLPPPIVVKINDRETDLSKRQTEAWGLYIKQYDLALHFRRLVGAAEDFLNYHSLMNTNIYESSKEALYDALQTVQQDIDGGKYEDLLGKAI